jgi:hypothetical protein
MYRGRDSTNGIEQIYVGRKEMPLGARCARLVRFGKPVATFLASSGQVRRINRGATVNISERSMEKARNFGCTTSSGGLAGVRRRRGSRK